MSKKDIHKTGALGAILGNKGLLTANEVMANKKKSTTLKNTETYNSLFNKEGALNDFTLIQISPSDCTPWQFANRSIDEFGDLKSLAASLKNDGQQEPILVRPSTNPDFKYEVIFGRRRYEAAKLENLLLIAICKELSDQEAAIAQKAENENRESISAYSEALHYKKLLDDKCFKSESALSRAINIPKATLSNLLSFAKIPDSIIQKVPNIHKVSIRIAVVISSLINKNKNYISTIGELAPLIGNKITSAKQLQNHIESLSASSSKPDKQKKEVESLNNDKGETLFTIESSSKTKTIRLKPTLLKTIDISVVKDMIMKLYRDSL